MKFALAIAALMLHASVAAAPTCTPLLNHTLKDIDGEARNLCAYAGKVILVVNTASNCGYTGQYKSLQGLYEKYGKQGFVVLGFPANDFGGQEPGSDAGIKDFCETNYQVDFPMFSKVGVVAHNANAFYEGLARSTGVRPAWNFHKYLIDRSGMRVMSFPSQVDPGSVEMVQAIETLLKAPSGNHKLTLREP